MFRHFSAKWAAQVLEVSASHLGQSSRFTGIEASKNAGSNQQPRQLEALGKKCKPTKTYSRKIYPIFWGDFHPEVGADYDDFGDWSNKNSRFSCKKMGQIQPQMGVSIHGGHPIGRWMVYHGKSSSNGWLGGTPMTSESPQIIGGFPVGSAEASIHDPSPPGYDRLYKRTAHVFLAVFIH